MNQGVRLVDAGLKGSLREYKERLVAQIAGEAALTSPGGVGVYYNYIPITSGCDWGKCSFCSLYGDTNFQVKPFKEITDFVEGLNSLIARNIYPAREKAFLGAGNSIAIETNYLVQILEYIYPQLGLKGVGSYVRARTILDKKTYLERLRQAGFTEAFMGTESGSDYILRPARKGITSEGIVEAAMLLRENGIALYATIILGMGGLERSEEHIEATARLLNEINPYEIQLKRLTLIGKEPLHEKVRSREFTELTSKQVLEEEIMLLRLLNVHSRYRRMEDCDVCCETMLERRLPDDKEELISRLEGMLENGDVFCSWANGG